MSSRATAAATEATELIVWLFWDIGQWVEGETLAFGEFLDHFLLAEEVLESFQLVLSFCLVKNYMYSTAALYEYSADIVNGEVSCFGTYARSL